jgi:NAD-dependent SIR2 family protein deacetylase
MTKTVYIIGAGFSAPAGGPDQSRLIEQIFALPNSDVKTRDAKAAFAEFLEKVLQIAPARFSQASLEDVYTPIDRCLADGVSLRGKMPAELRELRAQMEFLISVAIDNSFDQKAHTDPHARVYVDKLAEHLVSLAAVRAEKAKGASSAEVAKAYDPFSIISLNWDILLDKALYRALADKDGHSNGDYEPIGVVDYCCYISSIESAERRIRPGLWALGARGYNVKLLKIHGSMNWLQCCSCQRLYVSFDEKVNIPNFINAKLCRHCDHCGFRATLQGSLVMPTFLKDLRNFQIQLVWQNAGVELMEAERLVFIGYSFPHADFEFRQLLSRMVRKDAEIEVILYHDGTAPRIRHYDEVRTRYQQFFGTRTVSADGCGVAEYVKRLTSGPIA